MAEFKEQTLRRYQKAVDRKKVEDLKRIIFLFVRAGIPAAEKQKSLTKFLIPRGLTQPRPKSASSTTRFFRLFMNGSTQFRQSAFRKRKSTVGKSIKNSLKNCCIRLWKSLTFMKSLKTS